MSKSENVEGMALVLRFLQGWPVYRQERKARADELRKDPWAGNESTQKCIRQLEDGIIFGDKKYAAIMEIIDSLEDPERQVMRLKAAGKSIVAISFRISYSETATYDFFRRGCAKVLPILREKGLDDGSLTMRKNKR